MVTRPDPFSMVRPRGFVQIMMLETNKKQFQTERLYPLYLFLYTFDTDFAARVHF